MNIIIEVDVDGVEVNGGGTIFDGGDMAEVDSGGTEVDVGGIEVDGGGTEFDGGDTAEVD